MFVKIVAMRYFPLVLVAGLFCWLSPAQAQQIHCNPCSHAFGKVQIGGSGSFTIQLSNTGKRTLSINSKAVQGRAFSFASFALPVKLQPGANVTLKVTFTPTIKGYTEGMLTLVSNDPSSPLKMHVQGTGFYPSESELGVSPSTLNFGNVAVGATATLQATLTATGQNVTVSSDQSTSSEFTIVGMNMPFTIPAGQSVPVTIQFTPNASGTASAKAGFVSNALDSPTVELLTGKGMPQNQSHSVSLSWSPGAGNVVGYNVYRGITQTGPFQILNSALDASTNYTDSTVVSGATYYYVTTEVNSEGQESAYSNVSQAVIPNS